MEIGTLYFQELLSQIKQIVPQILNFTFIIDKTTFFGTTYKKVINNYIDERDHDIFSIKIGCQNFNVWGECRTINGRGIEYQHSYSIIHLEDYKISRIKKE